MRVMKLLCILGVFSLLLVSRVEAQSKSPKKDQASKTAERFEEASNLFKIKEYEQALALFKEIYLKTSEPALLFNIAQCHRNLGQQEDALKSYQLFIRDAPNNPLRANAEARIAEIKEEQRKAAALGAISISSKQDPAAIFLDGESKGNSPLTLQQITPGQHLLRVEKEGFLPSELMIEVIADQTVTLEVPMSLVPKRATEDQPLFARIPPKLASKLLVLSIGAGAGSVATGGLSLFSANRAKQAQDSGVTPTSSAEDLAANKQQIEGSMRNARLSAITADALLAVALLSGATVILHKKQTKKPEVSLAISTGAALLSVRY